MVELTGARESNAGDDFHFIWTAKKALKLLEPNTDFNALYVEGPSYDDSISYENNQDVLLSIDVAEYWGGEKYEEAFKVVFSQLKYSTRQGNLCWTLSNLLTTTNTKKNNSIIQRLAQTYKGFFEKFPNDREKLVLKLVSNRSIEEKFFNIIKKCKELIKENQYTQYTELKGCLDKEEQEILKKFYNGSKLKTTEFIGFIQCIDFTDCGTNIRDIQEAEVINSLANLGILDIKANYDKLMQFIRKQMLPEANRQEPIKKNLMANFFNVVPNGLFPANTYVIKPDQYIKREITTDLINKIMECKNQYICLHSTGGMGKTTIISDIGTSLPQGSVVLTYDCFGGGAYLDPATPLHTYKRAIVQLCNELALKCYTPFLVGISMDESEYLQSISERLKLASRYVENINSEARILIILDAIDNSFHAAEVLQEKCFVEKFLQITLPHNVSILVTSRTERLNKVKLPYDTIKIELKGFNFKEEKSYLEKFYQNISDEQIEEVRELTDGNPRIQYYVFTKVSSTLEEALTCIRPNGQDLHGIFKQALEKVDKRINADITSFEELCRGLVELPRPIPIDIISQSTDYDVQKLASACSEYLLGVYFANGQITFRDEDFEDYLRSRTKKGDTVIDKIASTLYNSYYDNYYSMRYAHIFLRKAHKINELLEIIYSIDNITIPIIDDEKNEVLSSEIKSAFSIDAIYQSIYRVDVYKLLYLQSKCSAIENSVKETIIDNMLLAKTLGLESSILRFLLPKANYHSLKELTIQAYGNILIGREEKADEYFAIAKETIKQYLEKPDEDRHFQYQVRDEHISQIALYLALRYNIKSCIVWLAGWNPYPVQEYFDVTYGLLLNDNINAAEELLSCADDIDMFAGCAKAFSEMNYAIKEIYWKKVDELLVKDTGEKKIRQIDYRFRIDLIETLLRRGKKQIAKKALKLIRVNWECNYISFYKSSNELSSIHIFRQYVVYKYLNEEEYDFEDFWKLNIKKSNDIQEDNKRRNETKKIVDFIINSFFIRIRAIDICSNNVPNIYEFCKEYEHCEQGRYQFYNNHNFYEYYKQITQNIFPVLLFQEKNIVKEYCVKFLQTKFLSNDFHFNIIKAILKDGKYVDIAAWYINQLDEKMNSYPQSSYDMRQLYLECSKITVLFDRDLSREYFLKALNASLGLDEEGYRRIGVFEKLSEKYCADENAAELTYNFTRIVEDTYRRLEDQKHLPQAKIFKLLTKIHPSSAIASACRLEDRDDDYPVLGYEISIPIILQELLEQDEISPQLAIALSNFDIEAGMAYDDIVKIVIKKLDGFDDRKQNSVLQVLTDDLEKISSGFCNQHIVDELMKWNANKNIDCIEILGNKYCNITSNTNITGRHYNYKSDTTSWDMIDKSKIEITKEGLISQMNSLDYTESYRLATYVLENTSYQDQLKTIKLILEIMYSTATSWRYAMCSNVLIDHLEEWSKYNLSIREWRENEENLDWILSLYNNETESFKEENIAFIVKLFLIDREVIISKLIRQIPGYLQSDPWKIYSFIETLAVIDSEENCKEVLEWCCQEEIRNVHKASSDREFTIEKRTEYTLEEAIAIYLIKMIGHAEKRKRWYAIHSIYNLYRMDEKSIIDKIMNYIFEDIPILFKDEEYIYFKDAAIVYFFIALRRIAEEDPSFIQGYLLKLKEIAFTENIINILHRELAKEIIILAEPFNEQAMTLCDVVRKDTIKHNRRHYNSDINNKTIFSFDTMDIIPYVYYFLGGIFQKSGEEVAQDCDKLITAWGFNNRMVGKWNDKFKTRKYQEQSYGYDTAVEDLSKYIQYNAMYYVADQYRKTLPCTDEAYPIYTFKTWVSQWLPSIQGHWMADFKSTPPNIGMFLDTRRYVKNEHYVIDSSIFRRPFEYDEGKLFILEAENTIEYEHSTKRHSMTVGIMDKNHIEKLLNETKVKNYSIEYSFIIDDESDSEDRFIEDVTDVYDIKDSSFEKFDPYMNGMSCSLLKPSEKIERYFNLEGIVPVDYCINIKNNLPVKSQYWSYSNDDRMYNFYSQGRMLFIEKHSLLKYLNDNPEMVVVAQLNVRYSDTNKGYGEKAVAAEKRVIFILNKELEDTIELEVNTEDY